MSVPAPTIEGLRRRAGRKWRIYGPEALACWIADMDFLPAPSIRATLLEAVELGDLGYGMPARETGVPEAFAAWASRRWDWKVDPARVQLMPDVIGGLYNCVEALTGPDDAVLVQTPIYPPFRSVVKAMGRTLVEHPMREDGSIDFEDLERTLKAQAVRMVFLCNPHNPSGRVFTEAELRRLADLAEAHDLVVVSDEVHADLAFAGHAHIPFATLSAAAAARTVTLNSPSKAFNIAGLRLAVCVADGELLRRLTALPPIRWTPFSSLGVRATLAAWSDEGLEWLDGCMDQLDANRARIGERLPQGVRWRPPEASYLAWLDFRALGLGPDPAAWLLDKAGVALSPGPEFGAPGEGFARLNFATSGEVLDQILGRIERALG